MAYASVTIDGEPVETFLDDPNDCRVQVETSDLVYCPECGNEIWDDGDGWDGHEPDCDRDGTPPDMGPSDIVNSAAITFDPGDCAVHVSISVGDPRGAFVMTIRRLTDGRLLLHTPYAGMISAHMPLREIAPGTFEIGP